jgi:molecular chaperone GrpE
VSKKNEKPKAVKAEEAPEQQAEQSQQEGELLEQLQRLQAEFDNYQKRVERDREEQRTWVVSNVINQLLPIVDNFELALKTVPEGERNQFYKGIEMIYAQMHEQFEKLGVTVLHAEGKFDPKLHEVLMAEEKEGIEKDTIIEVLQKGYLQNGKVIRPAKVKVAK